MEMKKGQATLADWLWVEIMAMQALIGIPVPEILGVALFEDEEAWILKFYVSEKISDDKEQDIYEVAGDTESYLDGPVIKGVETTDAIHKPIRSEVVVDEAKRKLQSDIQPGNECRFLFTWAHAHE
jgi:hypothetical protein